MATQTPNLNLTKPDVNDHISDTIPALATNFQTIDTSVTNNTNNITTIQNQMMTKTTAVQPSQLPAATTTALGGVKQGANVTIDADGTLHTADPYTLPVATSTALGGVKQGSNVTIAADGTLSANQYTLPVATTTTLGGVKQGANTTIDADGTIHVAAPYTLPVATATTIGGVKQGSNVTIAGDGTISSTVPVATSTTVGGVKQGSNVTIAADGTISAQTSYTLPSDVAKTDVAQTWTGAQTFNQTVTGQAFAANGASGATASSRYAGATTSGAPTTGTFYTGDYVVDQTGAIWICTTSGSPGTWTKTGSNYTLPVATASTLGGVKQGTGVTIAADGTLSANGGGYTLPVATSTTLGGVKQGANVTIDADGTLHTAAPYALPVATTTTLGGVKQGTGVTIAADGTISATGGGSTPIATTTTAGTVIVSDPNMGVDASGNLSLSSNVAKVGTAQTFTQTQGLGATNTATSSTNYGSNLLSFYRSYWNGSGAITANSMAIGVDGTGMLSFTNESSAMPFKVTQVGDGTFSNSVHAPIVYSSGMAGATASSRYVGATTSGAPTTGTFAVGDFTIDQTGSLYICTTAGTPGTWTQVKGNSSFGSGGLTSSGQVYSTYNSNAFNASASTGTPRFSSNAPGTNWFGIGPNSSSADNTVRIGNESSGSWSTPSGTFILKSDGALQAAGLTGATAASRYVGATASGAPASGTFAVGDFVIDQTGKVWICTTAGTPGTWTQVGGGASHFQTRIRLGGNGNGTGSPTTNTAMTNGYQFKFNASEWSTTTFYFEPMFYTNNASYTAYCGVWDVTAGAAVTGSEVSTAVASPTWSYTRSTSFTLTDGHMYTFYYRISNASGTVTVAASDLVALF